MNAKTTLHQTFSVSPPGAVALVLTGAEIVHQLKAMDDNFSEAPPDREERKNLFHGILLDLLVVAYLVLGSNFLYHHGMKPLAWGLVAVPIIMVLLTIGVALMELSKMDRAAKGTKGPLSPQ